MNDEYDLDINNYTYQDILNLFSISGQIDADSLRSAKRIAVMTHPDKSGLPTKVYAFYSQALKILHGIYGISCKTSSKSREEEQAVGSDRIWRAIGGSDQFCKKFNALFDEYKERIGNQDDGSGHGSWLASECLEGTKVKSIAELHAGILKRKKELGAIVLKPEVECLGQGKRFSVLGGCGSNQADLFTVLNYGDVREAYEGSLTPDFGPDDRGYNSLEALSRSRDQDDLESSASFLGEEALKYKKRIESQNNMCKLYDLVRADEESRWLTAPTPPVSCWPGLSDAGTA